MRLVVKLASFVMRANDHDTLLTGAWLTRIVYIRVPWNNKGIIKHYSILPITLESLTTYLLYNLFSIGNTWPWFCYDYMVHDYVEPLSCHWIYNYIVYLHWLFVVHFNFERTEKTRLMSIPICSLHKTPNQKHL